MDILLNGYFDKNFGDDAMHKMVVEYFKDHNFYVFSNQREMLSHLEDYDNVYINAEKTDFDMFLNVIGTGFMYNGKRAKAEKLLRMLIEKKKRYKKSALINCSLELFDNRLSEKLANYDLNKYDFITCRDKKTYEYLKANIRCDSIEMHNDMVFSGEFGAEGNKEYLGIAPIRRLYSDANFAYYREIAKFCDSYIEKNNKKVKLFAFDSGLENDISAALSVKAMMKNKEHTEIIMYNSDTDEFVKQIATCEFFVGSRFHSIVVALMNGIDTVAVYDNEKIKRLCEDFNICGFKKSDFTYELLMESRANKVDISIFKDAKEHIKSLERFIKE